MPKLRSPLLIALSWFLFSATPCVATMDPQYATPSATATIPSFINTSDTHAPTPPILLRPMDEAITADPRPELVWRHSEDEDSNTVLYTLFLNGVATYLGISDQGNSQGAGYTARIEAGDIRLLPISPLPDGVYTWRVEAYDLSHNTSSSTTWTFTIDTTPPSLTLIDLDHYHLPLITEGANFEIAGPKDVYFTVASDPFSTIQLTLTSTLFPIHNLSSTTNAQGLATLYTHLDPGVYSVTIIALDSGRNTTALPVFTLTITQALITVPIPGQPPLLIPYTPLSLPSLPATISLIRTSDYSSVILPLLLAIAIMLLLIFFWRRRYNLVLLDPRGVPLTNTKIYHSLPTTRDHSSLLLLTTRAPLSYELVSSDRGRLYISRLTRFSTLTIITNPAGAQLDSRTYILSLSAKRQVYTLIIG